MEPVYSAAMTLSFVKMHGLGNDFVVIDARDAPLNLTPAAVQALADRRRGVGCDTVIAVLPGTNGADAAMRFWNADGTQSDACGNGTRCVAALLGRQTGRNHLRLGTGAGVLACTLNADGTVTVDMGPPRLDWQQIPLAERMDTRTLELQVGPIDAPHLSRPSAVNMGNPHCVFFVENVAAHDLTKIGPMLEYHPLFPDRANIGLAEVRGPDRIRLRVWERGAGLTSACGTGACAALVAAARRRLTGRQATVDLDGGPLTITWREGDDHVLMTGPAVDVFHGTLAQAPAGGPA